MLRVTLVLFVLLLALPACDKASDSKSEDTKETVKEEPTDEPKEEPKKEPTAEAGDPDEAPEGSQWVDSEKHGVKFRVPEDWKVARDDASISATSPDETITALLVGTDSDGVISNALESIKKEVEFSEVKLEKDSGTTVNGMPGYAAEGSAVYVKEGGDQEIQFLMNSVRTAQTGVALMVFAEAEMYEAKKEELQGLLRTLQKR